MKIFTNSDNSVILKLLISAEYINKDIPIELVNVNDKRFQGPRRLPVLELESGVKLFSSNVAACHIFPPLPQDITAVEKWLDWEATRLQPFLVLFVTKPEYSKNIDGLLNELDTALQNSLYLVKEHISQADICIWATLYPLYSDEKLRNQFFNPRANLLKWFESLYSDKNFKEGEKKSACRGGLACLQSVASAAWYPGPVASSPVQPLQEPPSPSHDEKGGAALTEEEIRLAVEAWRAGVSARVKLKETSKPVLPVEGGKNILITSALPYVNNVPHLGNIIGCVLSADVFARFCRARGWTTLYVCGTDEYGTATETKALEEGLSPQEICDKYFAIHRDIYSWFNISFDQFGRTTTKEQKEVVQSVFQACHKNGYTSTAEMDQLFCEKCERFLADRFVEGTCPDCGFEDARGDQCDSCGHLINSVELVRPRCKQCSSSPVIRRCQQLFLDLPKIEGRLKQWVEETSDGWSANARLITKAWLATGLKPRCITRDLKWGVPVPLPGFTDKVFYVWFDAPIGYMSITKLHTPDWEKWWKKDPKYNVEFYQFMAKDNVPFHSIMFPASIYASQENYNIVNHLMATEYLNYEEGKFSKSRGVGVFGNDAQETGIPSDVYRFYLLFIRPESCDSNFSWADFATKINCELLNNLGNFINRGLMFCDKFYSGQIPETEVTAAGREEDGRLLGLVRRELKAYLRSLERARLREGLKYILNISRHGNLYIQSNKPWELVKGTPEERKRAGSVVGLTCQLVGLLASLLQPYMPASVAALAGQLNLPLSQLSIQEEFYPYFEAGHQIGKPYPLFNKIEPATAEALRAKYAGRQKSQTPERPVVQVTPQGNPTTKTNQIKDIGSRSQYETAIKSLEDAVTKQGDLVRKMKGEGKPKEEVKPMVDALLDLKKKLADLKADYDRQFLVNGAADSGSSPSDIALLEEKITAQGEKVRGLKSGGAVKAVWQPEVDLLLKLKSELAHLKGEPNPVTNTSSSAKKKKNKK